MGNIKNKTLFDSGFTLIEIMASLAIFLVVILMTGSFYILAQQTYNRGVTQNELVQNVRVSLDRLSRELRQARYLITAVASSTPVSELFFQDGHNLDEITYLYYYLNDTDLKRRHLAYHFATTSPDVYVYYDSVDAFGDPPAEKIFEDRVIGEFFTGLDFTGIDGLITIAMELTKGQITIEPDTKIYIRNW